MQGLAQVEGKALNVPCPNLLRNNSVIPEILIPNTKTRHKENDDLAQRDRGIIIHLPAT